MGRSQDRLGVAAVSRCRPLTGKARVRAAHRPQVRPGHVTQVRPEGVEPATGHVTTARRAHLEESNVLISH